MVGNKPKNLFYSFHGGIRRELLEEVVKYMDKISEMPVRENMNLEKMNRDIEFQGPHYSFFVRDIQLENPNGRDEVNYNCSVEGKKIKIRELKGTRLKVLSN